MNPYLLELEIKERRREMLEEAKRQHLVKLRNVRYPRQSDRLFLALADLLIRLGEHLQRRHAQPVVQTDGLCRE